MPKKIGAGGSPNMPLPVGGAQGDRPAPVAEQDGSSASSTPSASRPATAKEKVQGKNLRAQLTEVNRQKAEEWFDRLKQDVSDPLVRLAQRLSIANRIASNAADGSIDVKELLKRVPENQEQALKKEQDLEQYIEQFGSTLKTLKKEIAAYDANIPAAYTKAMACIDKFEALPASTKDGVFRAVENLRAMRDDAKMVVTIHNEEKVIASYVLNQIQALIVLANRELLRPQREALTTVISEGNLSDSVQADVEKRIADYDRLVEDARKIVESQIQAIEACDKMFDGKYRKDLDEDVRVQLRGVVKRHLCHGWMMHSIMTLLGAASNAADKLRMLVPLAMHDNGAQQENPGLREWHDLTKSMLDAEYFLAEEETAEMMEQEVDKNVPESNLSSEEVILMLQMAREGQNRFEKIVRTCESSIEKYENLTGIAKDPRVVSSLKEMRDAIKESIHSREHSVQFWADKYEELDRNESFLPPELRAEQSQRKKAQAQLSPGQVMQETTDGVVIGRINSKGELERLGEKGKVVCTYFEDDDGNWIRDYGGESDLAQAGSSSAPAAAGGKPKERETADLMEKAGRFMDRARQSSEKIRAEIEAIAASGGDYATRQDRKIDALGKALSRKTTAIIDLAGFILQLKKGIQGKDSSGETQVAELEEVRAQWKREKNGLLEQLGEAQKEWSIHSHKGRDPTEANFKFLWKEGQVASIEKSISRRKNPAREDDWLERYTISLKPGPKGEQYAPWIVHAHFDSAAAGATAARVHMKRDAEKDWGANMKPYHSPMLSMDTFDLLKQEVQKQETQKQEAGRSEAQRQRTASAKGGRRRR